MEKAGKISSFVASKIGSYEALHESAGKGSLESQVGDPALLDSSVDALQALSKASRKGRQKEHTPSDVLAEWLTPEVDHQLLAFLLANPSLPPSAIDDLAGRLPFPNYPCTDAELYLWCEIAKHPSFPVSWMEQIVERVTRPDERDVVAAIAANEEAPPEILRTIYARHRLDQLRGLAENPNTPSDILVELFSNPTMASRVAANPSCPVQEILSLNRNHRDPELVATVLSQPSATKDERSHWLQIFAAHFLGDDVPDPDGLAEYILDDENPDPEGRYWRALVVATTWSDLGARDLGRLLAVADPRVTRGVLLRKDLPDPLRTTTSQQMIDNPTAGDYQFLAGSLRSPPSILEALGKKLVPALGAGSLPFALAELLYNSNTPGSVFSDVVTKFLASTKHPNPGRDVDQRHLLEMVLKHPNTRSESLRALAEAATIPEGTSYLGLLVAHPNTEADVVEELVRQIEVSGSSEQNIRYWIDRIARAAADNPTLPVKLLRGLLDRTPEPIARNKLFDAIRRHCFPVLSQKDQNTDEGP
ncbi:hypothetical protein ACFL6C_10450 [Myxococcota bacterium]